MTIEIEARQFYPILFTPKAGKIKVKGQLHIGVTIYGLSFDIRGVMVFRSGDFWRFQLPGKQGMKNGKSCSFPIFSLNDQELHRSLIEAVRAKGIPFVEQYFLSNPLPIEEPQKRSHSQGQQDRGNVVKASLTNPNPTVFSTKTAQAPKKVFIDLPSRKQPLKKTASQNPLSSQARNNENSYNSNLMKRR